MVLFYIPTPEGSWITVEFNFTLKYHFGAMPGQSGSPVDHVKVSKTWKNLYFSWFLVIFDHFWSFLIILAVLLSKESFESISKTCILWHKMTKNRSKSAKMTISGLKKRLFQDPGILSGTVFGVRKHDFRSKNVFFVFFVFLRMYTCHASSHFEGIQKVIFLLFRKIVILYHPFLSENPMSKNTKNTIFHGRPGDRRTWFWSKKVLYVETSSGCLFGPPEVQNSEKTCFSRFLMIFNEKPRVIFLR